MKVGFVVHEGRAAAMDAARRLASWLGDRGVATRCLKTEIGADETTSDDGFADGLDLVVSVGGDGTLLRAAEHAHASGAPVFGVKVARLGFLTEIDPEEATDVLAEIFGGVRHVEERMAVVATVEGSEGAERHWALNEIIVEKGVRHRLVTLAVHVDGEYFTTLSGDGVIVASPTGSTAYSFSARGPIVSPRLDCLVLTPVAPHMVFDRPIVIAPDESVTVEVRGEVPGFLSADGREGLELPVGTRVRIARSPQPVRLFRRAGRKSFYRMVREKFDLPGDPRDASFTDPVPPSG